MPLGFSADEVDGLAPEPKSQLYVQVAPVEPVLVKFVARLPQFGALWVKLDVGRSLTCMVCMLVSLQLPLVAISRTVFNPELL